MEIDSSHLLNTEVFKANHLTVFYPETPRVPHHLAIALNRKEIRGFSEITPEENLELFATIKKMSEIYKTIDIQGFVIAQFDTPQKGHLDRHVVEIIPHLPGFQEVKNIADKADCNRYVLFRSAPLSPVVYEIGAIESHATFWKEAFQLSQEPLTEKDIAIPFPHWRKESHLFEANRMLERHFLELQGEKEISTPLLMPTQVPEQVTSVFVDKCPFCKEDIIERQLVYEYKNISVFYNIRKGAQPGSNFLILPKRHIEKVYGLTPEEIDNIRLVRKALTEVLKEIHPGCEVVVYIQDSPSTGQTVFHSHEQIVAIDPKTIALSWTSMSLYGGGNVSAEEMSEIQTKFKKKLEEKIRE